MKRYLFFWVWLLVLVVGGVWSPLALSEKVSRTRVLVTTDGEVDDQCSLVRFLLYANEWDIEGIITTSSQYHWQGHRWAGDDWVEPFLTSYAKVYSNLLVHDNRYPSPEFLRQRTLLGNVKAEGEMLEVTPGSRRIVEVLLDDSDNRPVWVQAWGGTNTLARALKTIEEQYPARMADVAKKLRFFFIWEQDETYQSYILPRWGKYHIKTIISDQFWALGYEWKKILPASQKKFFSASWMNNNVLKAHGPLCAMYKSHEKGSYGLAGDFNFEPGEFRSEGDSPAFLHMIPTGLRNLEAPAWGGWGGRYIRVRENTWLDPVPVENYKYPAGRWYTNSAWGRVSLRQGETSFNNPRVKEYFKPIWRWASAIQNDFAARADWSVKPFNEANHPPNVVVAHALDFTARVGDRINLDAKGTTDPDGNKLQYFWWHYQAAGAYEGALKIRNENKQGAYFFVPSNARKGDSIHVVLQVTDSGAPPLTRYQRVVVTVE